MTLRDLVVTFGYDIDRDSEKKAESSIKGIKNMASKLLGVIGIGFSIAGVSSLAEAAADAEALKSQFTQVFGGMEQEASSKLEAISGDTGVAVNRMKGSFSQIAAFAKVSGAEQAEALDIADRSIKAVTDSAAYYDRSIEEMTDSLQSFLKGNFENDAALGLACTETTRNAAANALYSKSFKDLSESEKQFTLLQMVEDANRASGALGQAARESDTWTNQLGNLKQSLNDLKAAAGSGILQPAVKVLKLLILLTQKATVAITKATSANGVLTRSFERFHALVKKLQPAIERMLQTLARGVAKGVGLVKTVVERLGGIENVLKILAVVAGAFFLAMNWQSVIGMAKKFLSLLTGVGKLFSVAGLKVAAVVAVIALLALAVEDFVHFLMGNDSLIGTIFDRTGIGADNARKAILDAWKKIKDFLLSVWDFLKTAAGMWVDTVKGFFEKHCGSIKANFERAWGLVKKFLSGVWTFICQLADTLFGSAEDSISGSTKSTKEKLLAIWDACLEALSAIWDALYEAGSAIFNAVASVVETVFGWIQEFWASWGDEILAWFKVMWDSVGGLLNGFLDVVKGVANFVAAIFTGDWKGAWEAIKDIFVGIWDMIKNAFTAVLESVKLTLSIFLSAVKAVWEKIWSGIKSFFLGIWNGIVSFFKDVVWNGIMNVISPIADFFRNVFQSAWDGICNVFSGVREFFTGIWDTITGVFSKIGTAIGDAIGGTVKSAVNSVLSFAVKIINGFITGINLAIEVLNAIPGVDIAKLDKLETPKLATGGIATEETLATIGEGSEPEAVIPLSKLGGMISSYIKQAKEEQSMSEVLHAVSGFAEKAVNAIAAFNRAAVAGSTEAGTVNNSSSHIVQNINITNNYSGGSMEVQKDVSKAMNQSAEDATTYMARGLAFARG